jgi:hypothetical protein
MKQADFSDVQHLQNSGFIKTTADRPAHIDSATRVALIRRGNELFNNGRIEQAKRVFITVQYGDGLIRIGDHYRKQNKPLEAFRMYWLSGDAKTYGPDLEKMAQIVQHWLREDNKL